MRRLWAVFVLWGLASNAAFATDHDNLDYGRPLRFEDAQTVAFREQDFEVGVAFGVPRRGGGTLGLSAEYLYGFAFNNHASLDFNPSFTGGKSDFGDAAIGVLHSYHRETLTIPAFAVRADALLPTGRESSGLGFRLRGIASRTVRQYGHLHLNADALFHTKPSRGERSVVPALTVGYSRPLGFPTRFDRTGLLEVAVRGGDRGGAIATIGAGIRQQVTVRSVFDVGLETDAAAWGGASREAIRLTAGYSTAF